MSTEHHIPDWLRALGRLLAPPASSGPAPRRWGLALATLAGLITVLAMGGNQLVSLLIVALAGVACFMIAFHRPELPPAALLLIAPFNYGFGFGGTMILKLSELVVAAMLVLILTHLFTGDEVVYRRLRRAGTPVVWMGLLTLAAVLTALPHPNAGNVRYEVENTIACLYVLLFFRRAWWPRLLLAALVALCAESVVALSLKFIWGKSGVSLFDVGGGVKSISLTADDLDLLAGGRFRLAGTMGHKNMLAAFYILLLPMVALDALNRKRLAGLLILIPSLVTLALTDSMTGWGALLLIVVLVLLQLRRFDYWLLATLVALPLAGLALYQYGDSVFERINQLLAGREGWGTVSSRHEIYEIGKRLVGEYPWLGIGRNNFLTYGKTFYGHAHNLFLMKVIEMGIPAGVAFALFIVGAMLRSWWTILFEAARLGRERQYYLTLGLWLGGLGFLGMNLLDYNYAHFALGPIFMMQLGIQLAIVFNLEAVGRPAALSVPPSATADFMSVER